KRKNSSVALYRGAPQIRPTALWVELFCRVVVRNVSQPWPRLGSCSARSESDGAKLAAVRTQLRTSPKKPKSEFTVASGGRPAAGPGAGSFMDPARLTGLPSKSAVPKPTTYFNASPRIAASRQPALWISAFTVLPAHVA